MAYQCVPVRKRQQRAHLDVVQTSLLDALLIHLIDQRPPCPAGFGQHLLRSIELATVHHFQRLSGRCICDIAELTLYVLVPSRKLTPPSAILALVVDVASHAVLVCVALETL